MYQSTENDFCKGAANITIDKRYYTLTFQRNINYPLIKEERGYIEIMNKLYFGDNLQIMREMADGQVDLICTDPPFNSGRDYNAFLTDSLAQSKAFVDTWTWDEPAITARADIEARARTSDTYKALDTCLKGYDLVLQNAVL